MAYEARDQRRALSIGVEANAADALPELLAMGAEIDVVTDQTSAHDPLMYLPRGVAFADMAAEREKDPAGFTLKARESMARHVEAMVGFLDGGAEVFDYGNSIRGEAKLAGYARAFAFPGFVPAYIRPLFCEGKGPFRWAALSGDPRDIAATDRAILDLFPDNEPLARWIRLAGERVHFQGLPGPHLLARLRRSATRRASGSTRWSPTGCSRPRSSSAATTSTAGASRPRTERPRACSTGRTPSPTGPCSTPWSTSPPARRGCRSTTAAASASAARSTRARSPWPTARRSRPRN